ncbi:hypothetical protein SAMN05421868_10381 [Paenibacillus naphthalenovorans]|nr:hypothetical protein SAMN05421868_10381 [Paenibacillus naphthalenovorans]
MEGTVEQKINTGICYTNSVPSPRRDLHLEHSPLQNGRKLRFRWANANVPVYRSSIYYGIILFIREDE